MTANDPESPCIMTYCRKFPFVLTSLLLIGLGGTACSEGSGDVVDGADASGASTGVGGSAVLSSGGSMDSSGGAGAGGWSSNASGGASATGGDASGGSAVNGGSSSGGANASGGDWSAGTGATGGVGSGGTAASGGSSGGTTFRSEGCELDGSGLGEGPHSFELASYNRRYIVRLPQNYDPHVAWPLVLALHPNGGELGYWDGTSGARNLRGHLQNEAVIIVVEAIGGNWRDYDLPESEWPARVQLELDYFDRVIGDAKSQLCVDERSIFAMGFSGGGSFSGVLGCYREDIRAFAAGGSVIYFDPANCTGTAAAWIVLSEEDDTEDRRAYLDFFAEKASCDDADYQDQSCHEYQGCAPESPVTFCHYSGGHEWPSFGLESSWEFFEQFIETAQ